jgi:dipeptidase
MKHVKWIIAGLIVFLGAFNTSSNACTNFLITKGASTDGSTMISYAADSHVLYGELYYWEGGTHEAGEMLDIVEWDTQKPLGKIKQVKETYTVVGNMNEHQLAIAETTYGGRKELHNQPGAIMDYGSLIYVTLQRAKTAREAVKVMAELVEEYGYYSSGESFSIADKNEVWIMEMIGKGEGEKGAVWVARMIPDGYVSGHANQARIQTFPLEGNKSSITSTHLEDIMNPGVTTAYSEDVISFARKKGYFEGKDKDFSFSDTYAPVDFGGARFCDARVWSMFRQVKDGMDKYEDYAAGHNLENRMPLWVEPQRKISVQDMFAFMRDHYEGSSLDMTKDLGAGPYKVPYRWRPLYWEVDGETYFNERAVATQQTGFSFVTQSRDWLPDPIGGVNWFSVDDASSTVYVPLYCGLQEVPGVFAVGNGSMSEWSDNAAFWVFNQLSNFAYTRYDDIHPYIEEAQKNYEDKYVEYVAVVDNAAHQLYKEDKKKAEDFVTEFSVNTANNLVDEWKELYQFLFMKFMDGNIKKTEGREFLDNGYDVLEIKQPGYSEEFYKKIIEQTGEKFKVPEKE